MFAEFVSIHLLLENYISCTIVSIQVDRQSFASFQVDASVVQWKMQAFASRLLLLLLSCLFSTVSHVHGSTQSTSKSIQLSYQSLHETKLHPLATVSYDPTTFNTSLQSWTPPDLASLPASSDDSLSAPLVRVLTPAGGSTVTSLSTFNNTLNQTISLWLSPARDGTIISAAVSASAPLTARELKEKAREERRVARSQSKAKKARKSTEHSDRPSGNVWIDLRPPAPGPMPALIERKVPSVEADGQEFREEAEKSFFQKYWWILIIGAIFAMQGGGGDK